jgi:WD40 repeat protein
VRLPFTDARYWKRVGYAAAVALALVQTKCSGSQSAPVVSTAAELRLVAQMGLPGHGNFVLTLAASPDDRLIATSSPDGIILWDGDTGREIWRNPSLMPFPAPAFSRDSRKLLMSSVPGFEIWDIHERRPISRFEPVDGSVVAAAIFGYDDRTVITVERSFGRAEHDSRAWIRVVSIAEGVEKTRIPLGSDERPLGRMRLDLSPDGRALMLVDAHPVRRIDVYDLETGSRLHQFDANGLAFGAMTFSADGRRILTSTEDGVHRTYDLATGEETARIASGVVGTGLDFTSDGRALAVATVDGQLVLVDFRSGRILRRFDVSVSDRSKAAFLANGRRIIIDVPISSPRTCCRVAARVIDIASGHEVQRLAGEVADLETVSFSKDGRWIATGGPTGAVHVWDATVGREVYRLNAPGPISQIDYAPNGQFLAAVYEPGVRVWDAMSRRRRYDLLTEGSKVVRFAISANSRRIATGHSNGDVQVWDADSGSPLMRFSARMNAGDSSGIGQSARITRRPFFLPPVLSGRFPPLPPRILFAPERVAIAALAFQGDSLVVAASNDGFAHVWDIRTATALRQFNLVFFRVSPMSSEVSRDGNRILAGPVPDSAIVWDASGRMLGKGPPTVFSVGRGAFSADGHLYFHGGTGSLWEITSGVAVRSFDEGDRVRASASAFSSDASILLTASREGSVHIRDASTGAELARLISFNTGEWVVIDPEGRFDGSNGGDVDGLHWVAGTEVIALSQLKDRYYEPGLLAKILGHNPEPVRDVEPFRHVDLYPEFNVESPSDSSTYMTVQLRNRGGGIGRVVVSINGKEMLADARPRGTDAQSDSLRIEVDLAAHAYLIPGDTNLITVRAYNAAGYLSSRGLGITHVAPGASEPPRLWALVAGVSDYAGNALDLRYAADDATAFGAALRVGAERLFGSDRVNITVLTTADSTRSSIPTRRAIIEALDSIAAKAASTDVLVLYLAGHGVTHGGQDGDLYYLTREATTGNLEDDGLRAATAISSAELTERIQTIAALKQVLILDICGAARAIDKLSDKREIPSSQVRALERLKDRAGLFVLAGSAADAVSYEASRWGHGVLTYALLFGMKGAALHEDAFVDVGTWFNYAVDEVPRLAGEIGGIQQPILAMPRGGSSFPVGELPPVDREAIQLAAPRPLVLRSSFQDDERLQDGLGLARRVDEALRVLSWAGAEAPFAFVDAREFPDAYTIVGRYRHAGNEVDLTIGLFRGSDEVDRFTVAGTAADLDALADRIVDGILQRIATIAGEGPGPDGP